jgi:dihydroflavonol-4-reductase
MRIAVTGASGHVGANLCRMLVHEGHQVRALIHEDIAGLEDVRLDLVFGNVKNESDLVNLCKDCEVVFHLAAYISIRKRDPECNKVNAESCVNLIRAARKTGVRKVIHFSSIHAFREDPLNNELDESRELALSSKFAYDKSKALGQQIMMGASSRDLEIVVLNPTAIIGPNDFKPSLLGKALIRFYKGQNPGLVPGGYNWVDVRDVCLAAVNAIHHGTGGECYLLGGSWQSLRTLTGKIGELGGHKPPSLELPVWVAMIGIPFLNLHALISRKTPLYTSLSLHTLKHSHRNISSKKAEIQLNFRPRPFDETISDTLNWFRGENYL